MGVVNSISCPQSPPGAICAATLAYGITVVFSTTHVCQRSPAWHRAARRKRARARFLLRTSWPTSPARAMAGAARLQSHHGSTVPASFEQSWQCHVCEESNGMTDTICQRCGHAAGFQKPPPDGMWRCVCGLANSHYYRFCRACQTPVAQKIRFPLQEVKGKLIESNQGMGQRWAPYLAAHPRCPLMPPPPGRPPYAGGPPVVWRPVGRAGPGLGSAPPPPPPPGMWNQGVPMEQPIGQPATVIHHAGSLSCFPCTVPRQGWA